MGGKAKPGALRKHATTRQELRRQKHDAYHPPARHGRRNRHAKARYRPPNRDFLLRVRRGELGYEELLSMAEDKIRTIEAHFAELDLPEQPDFTTVNALLIRMRQEVYASSW